MKNLIKTSLIAGALALIVVSVSMPVASAEAQTLADLQAQIQLLLVRIQQLQNQASGQTTNQASISLFRNLGEGMSGADVRALQQFLNSDPMTVVAVSGPGSKGYETMFFGPATKAAVIKFQNKYRLQVLAPVGLSQGTGFVGPATRSYVNSLGVTNQPSTPTTNKPTTNKPSNQNGSAVVGQEGDIEVTRGSDHTSTLELSGDFDQIYSIQVKANDSAMTIDRIDFMFDKKVWRYIDTFALYQNDKRIAKVEITEDDINYSGNEYRLRFSGLGAVVAKGDKDTFVLEAKALDGLSASREEDTLSVYVPERGVRAMDTAKITTQEPANDLGQRTFDFRNAENDGEIIVTLASDSPESGVIQVKESANTTNVPVMLLKLKADESDITVDEMYVKVDSSESNVSDVVRTLSLVSGNKTDARESVIKNGASAITDTDEEGNDYTIIEPNEYYVYFKDLNNITISEGEHEELALKAEFYKQSGRYDSGTEVNFTVRAVYGENKYEEEVVSGDITTGSNQSFTLYTKGLTYTFAGEKAETETENSIRKIGLFTLSFDVTAFGDDVYIPASAGRQVSTTTVGSVGAEYTVINGSWEIYVLGDAADSLTVKGVNASNGFFKINEGTTKRVTLMVSLKNSGAVSDFYHVELEALRFRIGSPTGDEYTVTSGFSDFETSVVSIKS